jgi:hypothetical protein
MRMPTFIEVPVTTVGNPWKKFIMWVNPEQITSVAEQNDGTAIFDISGHCYVTVVQFPEFMRMLRIAGCRLLTRGDIDLIGEPGVPGEEGVK